MVEQKEIATADFLERREGVLHGDGDLNAEIPPNGAHYPLHFRKQVFAWSHLDDGTGLTLHRGLFQTRHSVRRLLRGQPRMHPAELKHRLALEQLQ